MKPDDLSLREIINQLNDINTKLTVLLTLSNDAARGVDSGACSAPPDRNDLALIRQSNRWRDSARKNHR